MLTRNFLSIISNESAWHLDNVPETRNISNEEKPARFNDNGTYGFQTYTWDLARFVIGTGTTKPKHTDYVIESEITKSYDCSSPLMKKYIQGAEKDILTIGGVITNTDSTNIEFCEICLYIHVNANGESDIMVAREVYDTPIIIAPGESVAVSVNII